MIQTMTAKIITGLVLILIIICLLFGIYYYHSKVAKVQKLLDDANGVIVGLNSQVKNCNQDTSNNKKADIQRQELKKKLEPIRKEIDDLVVPEQKTIAPIKEQTSASKNSLQKASDKSVKEANQQTTKEDTKDDFYKKAIKTFNDLFSVFGDDSMCNNPAGCK